MKKIQDITIGTESVLLKNQESNVERRFILRPFKKGDETGMIECIRDEYGNSYFKKKFYNPDWIIKESTGDNYSFFVVESESKIAGVMILTFFPGESYIEPATQIIKKEFRGYGVSVILTRYIFSIVEQLEPSAIYGLAVTFHDITQKAGNRLGMTAVGFRLGTFLTSKMENSYVKGRCVKHSEVIMVRAAAKKNAGTVYLPEDISDFAGKIYKKLGVEFSIVTEGEPQKSVPEERCEFTVTADDVQQFVTVKLSKTGSDLKEQMKKLIDKYKGKGYWTIQINLLCDTPAVFKDYDSLREIGFFFTGLKPLCSDREQFYMQWIDEWPLIMEDYVLTDSFKEVRDEIGKVKSNQMG